jgi:fucose permease
MARGKSCIEWFQNNKRTVVIVILTSLIILIYSGMEIVYWEFLSSYLQTIPLSERISDERASYMMAAVTYGFMASRGVGIFVSAKVDPSRILIVDFVILVISCVSLLSSESMFVVWSGNILNGIAFGTIYPQIYALVAKEIEVTNFYSSLFVLSSGLTAAYYPQLVSSQISMNHQFLIWLVFSSVVASGILLITFVIFVKKYPSRQKVLNQEMLLVIKSRPQLQQEPQIESFSRI